MGVAVDGRFPQVQRPGRLRPGQAGGRAAPRSTIELAAIDAGSAEANDEAKTKNWFHIQQFPKASFVSSSVKAARRQPLRSGGQAEHQGQGAATWWHPSPSSRKAAAALFEGSFVLKRLEFGIGVGPWGDTDTVADEVQVKFKFAGGRRGRQEIAVAAPAAFRFNP
ncbi:MAG: YceI family protein [Comamonadaceae bacterium]|nr:YceI family protein [Comamonadaceae bacterium]